MNLYAYIGNDPVNGVDPSGEKGYLISRPLGSKAPGATHLFVIVVDDKTGKVTRFSYGPNKSGGPRKLVSLTDSQTRTDRDDRAATTAFLETPNEASWFGGINGVEIDASDEAIIASGEAVDRALGTKENPGSTRYNAVTGPSTPNDAGNSNSATYAVADRSNPAVTQALPPSPGFPVGYGQSDHIPVTGVVSVSGRIESNNLSKCGESRC